MANVKITDLPAGTTLTGVEVFESVQSGNSVQLTADQIKTFTSTLPTFVGNAIVINTAKTPASSTATGVAGTICWDTSYLYICTATNTWTRIALAW